jgi:membrane-associated phospholipid phosphatase
MSATVLGYIICYIIYLVFPTESPARTLSQTPVAQLPGGPFHWAVNLIQHHGGVHGNAFPSGHIMSAAVTLLFALRYTRRLGWVLLPLFLLMCVGSVYDRYHYFSDVVAGALIALAVSVPFLRTKHFSR